MEASPLMSIIQERRSVRTFDPDRDVEQEKLEIMLEAARLAPSSNNTQPWHFVVVRNPDVRKKLSAAAPAGLATNKWMAKAPVIIVCCVQPALLEHRAIGQLMDKQWYVMDVAIAVEHMVLAAQEQGLGTCWLGWIDERKVRRAVGAPRDVRIAALLPVGYPKNGKWPPAKKRKPMQEVVSWDKFGYSQ
jgi:nitroreductase